MESLQRVLAHFFRGSSPQDKPRIEHVQHAGYAVNGCLARPGVRTRVKLQAIGAGGNQVREETGLVAATVDERSASDSSHRVAKHFISGELQFTIHGVRNQVASVSADRTTMRTGASLGLAKNDVHADTDS